MNKGDLMKLVFTEDELRNVDSAIPMNLWNKVNSSIHVMDYNQSSAFGTLVNLYKKAMQKNIIGIDYSDEYTSCISSNEYFYNNYCRKEGEPFYTSKVYHEYQNRVVNANREDFIDKMEDHFKIYPADGIRQE